MKGGIFLNTNIKVLEDDGKLTKYLETSFPTTKVSVTNGNVSIYEKTNIKKINPITYNIKTSKSNLIVLYFKCNEIKDKKYYISSIKQDFSLVELKEFLQKTL